MVTCSADSVHVTTIKQWPVIYVIIRGLPRDLPDM